MFKNFEECIFTPPDAQPGASTIPPTTTTTTKGPTTAPPPTTTGPPTTTTIEPTEAPDCKRHSYLLFNKAQERYKLIEFL